MNLVSKYKFQSLLTLGACVVSYLSLHYADAYAWYLRDLNAGIESTPSKYLAGNASLYSFLNLVFLVPAVVILLNKTNEKIRYAWMFIAIALMCLSIYMVGEGGDRKGCKACFGVYLIYYMILPIPAILSSIWGIHTWKNSARPKG